MEKILSLCATTFFLITFSLPTLADKRFSEKDLDGTYLYNLVEIRTDETTGTIDYCDQYGAATFNGDGTGHNTGTRKCSFSGPATNSSDITYTVSADGVVLIKETNDLYPTRGQIVDKARMVLIDSTTRLEPNIFVQHGVAVEK